MSTTPSPAQTRSTMPVHDQQRQTRNINQIQHPNKNSSTQICHYQFRSIQQRTKSSHIQQLVPLQVNENGITKFDSNIHKSHNNNFKNWHRQNRQTKQQQLNFHHPFVTRVSASWSSIKYLTKVQYQSMNNNVWNKYITDTTGIEISIKDDHHRSNG